MKTQIDRDLKFLLDENERLIKKIQWLENENRKLKEQLKKLGVL